MLEGRFLIGSPPRAKNSPDRAFQIQEAAYQQEKAKLLTEPVVRCRQCGWCHIGVAEPQPALDRCFRCKGRDFEVISERRGAAAHLAAWRNLAGTPLARVGNVGAVPIF